jgi:hypothetical protein
MSLAYITSIQESYHQAEREKELEKELSNPKGKLLSSENQVDELLWKLDLLTVALNALSDTQEKNEDLTETAKKNRRKSSQC